MSDAPVEQRCPECGEPVGQTATYCMHCWADLPAERPAADGVTGDETDAVPSATRESDAFDDESGQLLDPDGLVDNTLTVVVGIAGGLVVGLVETIVLVFLTESGWALVVGLLVWLGATGYLVRRRTVQEAVAKTCYAVALVLLSTPVIVFGPGVTADGGSGGRAGAFLWLLFVAAIPAAIAAAVGWVASRFVPAEPGDGIS